MCYTLPTHKHTHHIYKWSFHETQEHLRMKDKQIVTFEKFSFKQRWNFIVSLWRKKRRHLIHAIQNRAMEYWQEESTLVSSAPTFPLQNHTSAELVSWHHRQHPFGLLLDAICTFYQLHRSSWHRLLSQISDSCADAIDKNHVFFDHLFEFKIGYKLQLIVNKCTFSSSSQILTHGIDCCCLSTYGLILTRRLDSNPIASRTEMNVVLSFERLYIGCRVTAYSQNSKIEMQAFFILLIFSAAIVFGRNYYCFNYISDVIQMTGCWGLIKVFFSSLKNETLIHFRSIASLESWQPPPPLLMMTTIILENWNSVQMHRFDQCIAVQFFAEMKTQAKYFFRCCKIFFSFRERKCSIGYSILIPYVSEI